MKSVTPQCWQVVLGAPECQSYVFDADGKVTSFTGEAQQIAG